MIRFALIALAVVAVNANDEPLGRNYRKNGLFISNAHNNGKIPAVSESKVTAVSLKPGQLSTMTSLDQLKTSASDNKDSFSIGLGVLSPSYSQKFGEDGKTKLDFNSDQGGFSYSLTNVVHPSPGTQPNAASAPAAASPIASKVQSEGFVPSAYYNNPTQSNPQVNIYHKQSADAGAAIYGRLAGSNQYPAPPTAPAAAPSPNPAAAYGAAQQAAFGAYPGYGGAAPAQPAPTGPAPGTNPLANFPSFASGLTDAEKSFLQTVPQSHAAQPNQYAQPNPYAQQSPYPSPASAPISPYAGSPYAGQHVHSPPNTYSPNSYPAAPTAASAGYPTQQIPQQPAPNPYASAYATAASSHQPKLVSQQQLTANPSPSSIVHNAGSPYGASPDQFMNPYMAAAASMYNPAYASMGGQSASSAYPSVSPYDMMNDFMY